MNESDVMEPADGARILAGGEIGSIEGGTIDETPLQRPEDLWAGREIAVPTIAIVGDRRSWLTVVVEAASPGTLSWRAGELVGALRFRDTWRTGAGETG